MSGWICLSGDVLVLEPCVAEVRAASAGAPHRGTGAVGGPSSRGRGSGSAVPDPKAVVAFLPRACPSTGLQLPPPRGRTGAQVFAKSRDLARFQPWEGAGAVSAAQDWDAVLPTGGPRARSEKS